MPAINFSGQTITITGVTGTSLSCASTSGLYVGLVGSMVDSVGANSTRVTIQTITNETTLVCRFQVVPVGRTFSDYNGGQIFFDNQVAIVDSLYATLPGGKVPVAQLPNATAGAAGAMSAAQFTKVDSIDLVATAVVPAFVAGAATIAPGTDKCTEYIIEAERALSVPCTLTVSTANSPRQGNKYVNCRALALGQTITIVNGGAAAGTIGTIDASLTKGMGVALWFDGTNYFFNGYYELSV